MTTYTKAELRNRILKDAQVLDIYESASAQDADNVDDIVQQSLDELEVENVVIFNAQAGEDTDAIPGRVFLPLADFVRSMGLASYDVAPDGALRADALRRLRRMTLIGSDDSPTKATYF